MSYQLNKTNGDLLTELIDGQVDNNSTNLTLVGKNFTGYGEYINENFIKILENFANTSAPSNPLQGQLWWDTTASTLKIFDGTVWKTSGGSIVASQQPALASGEFWIDNLRKQVYAYDGTSLIFLGPVYSSQQGKSGFEVSSVIDNTNRSRTVVCLYVGGTLVGLYSEREIIPSLQQRELMPVLALVNSENVEGRIKVGFNVVDKQNFVYHGTAESASSLLTPDGDVLTTDNFLSTTRNNVATGSLQIVNSAGIIIGQQNNTVLKIVNDRFYVENQVLDQDLSLRVKSTLYGSSTVNAIYVDASTGKVGIFNNNRLPEYNLDVEGDLRVTGNLIVEGETTFVDVSNIGIEDKNIELATNSDGETFDNQTVDNGGIILKSSDGDKQFLWKNLTQSWTSTEHLDLDSGKEYRIGGNLLISETEISSTVTSAPGITQVGNLQNAIISNFNINNNTISSTNLNGNIVLSPNGTGFIDVDDSLISNVAEPQNANDATNRAYVDVRTVNQLLSTSLDITGLNNGTISEFRSKLSTILEEIFPVDATNAGKQARIHAVDYSGTSTTVVDVESAKNPSYISVDANGTLNESVLQDVEFDAAIGTVSLSPNRYLIVYEVQAVSGGYAWVHVSTTPTSY